MNADEREQNRRRWVEFGAWVRKSREAQKPDAWTQERLAQEIGVRREWVNQIENGAKPGPDTETALRKLFGDQPATDRAPVDLAALIASNIAMAAAMEKQAKAINRVMDYLLRIEDAGAPGTEDDLEERDADLLALPETAKLATSAVKRELRSVAEEGRQVADKPVQQPRAPRKRSRP